MEVKDLPQITQSTESDFVVSSTSQKTRLISFKNIFEKISFSSLATKAKNIIGAINELNTDKSNKLMVKLWNYASANVQNTSVAVDGYTALGVVGWYVPNTSGVFCQLYVNDNKLTMASSLTSQVSVRVYILYEKN